MVSLRSDLLFDSPNRAFAIGLKRRNILGAIELHAREVLADLKSTVMPKWTKDARRVDSWYHLSEDEDGEPRDLGMLELSAALLEWSERHHMPWDWARDAGLQTVSWWRLELDDPASVEPPHLVDQLRWATPTVCASLPRVLGLPRALAWDPTIETLEAFSKRVEDYKAAVCAAYEAAGYVPIKAERERLIPPADRPKFYVLRAIKGWSFAKISADYADADGNPTENAICQSVRAFAREADVPLEES